MGRLGPLADSALEGRPVLARQRHDALGVAKLAEDSTGRERHAVDAARADAVEQRRATQARRRSATEGPSVGAPGRRASASAALARSRGASKSATGRSPARGSAPSRRGPAACEGASRSAGATPPRCPTGSRSVRATTSRWLTCTASAAATLPGPPAPTPRDPLEVSPRPLKGGARVQRALAVHRQQPQRPVVEVGRLLHARQGHGPRGRQGSNAG